MAEEQTGNSKDEQSKSTSPYKIEHDRENCIGCTACAAVVPDFWVMKEDNKSSIINGKKLDTGWEELDIEQEKYDENKEAADACPVNVIHIKDMKKNERII